MLNVLNVEIYQDFVCPWCFVGTRRFGDALAEFGEAAAVNVQYHPYLLHPNTPPEGIDLRGFLEGRYQQDPQRIFERVEAAAREVHIPIDFSRITRSYSTVPAHTLVRHAHHKGSHRALADALFAAYFVEGTNIADHDALTDLAIRHGFTSTEAQGLLNDQGELALTRNAARDALARGIRGVPLYVLNGRHHVSGAQAPRLFRLAIAQALDLPNAAASETTTHA